MSRRGLTLLVLLVLVAAFAWIVFRAPAVPVPSTGARLLGMEFEPLRVEGRHAESRWHLERRSGGWSVTGESTHEADPRAVGGWLRSLGALRLVREVDADDEALAAAGTGENAPRLLLSRGDERRLLVLGRRSPVGPERYLQIDEERLVLVEPAAAALFEEAGVERFRERRLCPVPERVNWVRVNGRSAPAELTLDGTGGGWEVRFDGERDVADPRIADVVARAYEALRIPSPATAEPGGPWSFEFREEDRACRLRAGPAEAADRVSVCRDDGSLCGELPRAALEPFLEPLRYYREPRLAFFSLDEVLEVRIENAGAVTTWAGTDRGPLLARLQALRSIGFEADRGAGDWEERVVLAGAGGELGWLQFANAPETGQRRVRSSWRPGWVARVSREDVGELR